MSTAEHDPPESSTPGRPWASGRVLSVEQRERKRQANRNSNRFLRTDLLNRMQALEDRVIQLESWRLHFKSHHSPPPSPTYPVWSHGDSNTAPRDHDTKSSAHPSPRLQGALFDSQPPAEPYSGQSASFRQFSSWSLNHSNHAFTSPIEQAQPASDSLQLPFPDALGDNTGFQSDLIASQQENIPQSSAAMPTYQKENFDSLSAPLPLTMTDSGASPSLNNAEPAAWPVEQVEQPRRWAPDNRVVPVNNPSAEDADLNSVLDIISAPEVVPFIPLQNPQGREITVMCNLLVRYVRSLTPDTVCLNDTYNQDVIIRAVFQGWDQAFSRYPVVCPLWRVIRYVDYQLFRRCNVNERICALRILQTMYSYEVLRNAKCLPPWYKPRPSQQCLEHEPVVDHLAWPGLRERLSIAENNTLTNRFWYEFGHNFRFLWPHTPLEAFHLRPGSPHYQISAEFANCMQDIGRYRMRSEFFVQFPLLYDDIGAAEHLPLLWMRPTETYSNQRLKDGEQGEASEKGTR